MAEQNLVDPASLLNRLSHKPGVQSTIVLSTESGAIIRASGAIVQKQTSKNDRDDILKSAGEAAGEANGEKKNRRGIDSAETLAKLAFDFVKVAGNAVESLDKDDDVRLLRLRTKKVELVIVPDPKYILVVIHDMPSA